MCIYRILEELFPFIYYIMRSRSKKRLCNSDNILSQEEYINYSTLSQQQLICRLEDEHQRALQMDEKTVKFTLSFSIGFTFLGLAAAFLIDSVHILSIKIILIFILLVGIIYVFTAGLIALHALRTLPRYGYGTQFLLLLKQSSDPAAIMADALARQENMNIVRHLRNETSYQALRTGLCLLFFGTMIFATTLVYQSFCSVPDLP